MYLHCGLVLQGAEKQTEFTPSQTPEASLASRWRSPARATAAPGVPTKRSSFQYCFEQKGLVGDTFLQLPLFLRRHWCRKTIPYWVEAGSNRKAWFMSRLFSAQLRRTWVSDLLPPVRLCFFSDTDAAWYDVGCIDFLVSFSKCCDGHFILVQQFNRTAA